MFGNTHQVAQAIARGLEGTGDVTLVNVNEVLALTSDLDLLLVGGPTHVHGMSHEASRLEAHKWSLDPAKSLTLERDAPGTGVREWLDSLTWVPPQVAAFDTRADMAELLSGAASRKIEHELVKLGGAAVLPHESFLVQGNEPISSEELRRANAWGAKLASAATKA
jgi:menaquinone-dependent protoporphyrinogen IX oxidase